MGDLQALFCYFLALCGLQMPRNTAGSLADVAKCRVMYTAKICAMQQLIWDGDVEILPSTGNIAKLSYLSIFKKS